MSLEKVTVFKIRDAINSFDGFVRAEDSKGRALPALSPLTLPEDIDFEGEVEISAAFKAQQGAQKNEDDIPWLSFLNEGRPADQRFQFQSRNTFPCALVAVKITQGGNTNFYALTFGLGGEGLLKSDTIVRDFGLRVAMNICDKDRLKRVQTSIHEAISTQAEKQISIGSSFSVFNINDEKEFLRAVSGAAKQDYGFITSFTGRDSIAIKLDKDDRISWLNIVERVHRLGQAYELNDYAGIFRGYAKFHFENDPHVVAELDRILFERIKANEVENVHLAPPEFVDFEQRSFSYREDEDAPRYDDLSLGDMLASKKRAFSEKSSIHSIRSMRIYVWDLETGVNIKDWSAYQCLVAEIEHNGSTYILSLAQWKQVSAGLKDEVDNYVRGIHLANAAFLLNDVHVWDPNARQDKDGNPVGENRESTYNLTVAAASNDVFLFDTAKLEIAGDRSYEICDLLHSDKSLIHVKRLRSGAASITHLFLQGRFYGDAFLRDARCREAMRDHIAARIAAGRDPTPFISIIHDNRKDIVANQYRVVFCVLSDRAGVGVTSLPFMARYELMHTHRHLQDALGFQCELAFRQIRLGP